MKKGETVAGMCTLGRRAARAGHGRQSGKETLLGLPFSSKTQEEMPAASGSFHYGLKLTHQSEGHQD